MSGLMVVPVRTHQELGAFIGLPFRLYRQDPYWVAPLRGQQRRQLDRDRNPFFLDPEAASFLVRRDGRTVGRVCAHIDHRYNRFHSQAGTPDTTGFFGFFECEQDPVAAAALVDAAVAWLAEHGSTQMLGPASFTFLDEAGLLVDGYTSPPTMLMAYNLPYYRALLERAGCTPIQELYAWRLDASTQPPADLVAVARSAEAQYRFRHADPRHPDQEQRRFLEVVNAAFEQHWGLRPLTQEEAGAVVGGQGRRGLAAELRRRDPQAAGREATQGSARPQQLTLDRYRHLTPRQPGPGEVLQPIAQRRQ